MILLPAIDIQGGRCVRLMQGDFATSHEVAADPLSTALRFKAAGAAWVHMVDLDGALTGRRENEAVFLKVAAESGLRVELGGGIRDMDSISFYLQKGISRIILGTSAIRNPELVAEAVSRYGERIAVGIDAKDGQVMASGWSEAGHMDYLDLAEKMDGIGVGALIFTDIARDGMLSGPNLEQLAALRSRVSCPVIASGGIQGIGDVAALAALGVYGAICGKAIYSGDLDLAEAIRILAK
ncbi:MAG: 1-(5-phosphoribosyl)-5-[(5-phosphoribosylamino)methylideneamino]imidazole-4-carboxamide isomerase [Clostridiales bacterium]|nr:1-(5-phosphoribosyl)-5-[(5-phosphoribosylamino)methylideneamino]imidazole-4-carboxamide isomerase [Clostridiales bacterium]